jgi:PAS domain S-box-containing protein
MNGQVIARKAPMKHRIFQLLAAPTFEDEDKSRSAYFLNTILLIFLLVDLVYIAFSVLTIFTQSPPTGLPALVRVVIIALMLIALRVVLRKSYVRVSAFTFLVFLWSVITFGYITVGGIKASGLSGYIVTVIVAALLLGGRAAIVTGAICVLAGWGLLYGEQTGQLTAFVATPLNTVILGVIQSVYIILSSALLYLAATSIRKAMDRARQHERALAERNQDLQREIILHSQAEDAYRLLVEQMSQGLLIFQDNHITYANNAVAELCGRSVAELLAMPDPFELIHPDDRDAISQSFQARIKGKPTAPHEQFRVVRRDGQSRWLELFISQIMYRGTLAIQIITIDVTERRKDEEALRASAGEAKQFQDQLKALHEVSIELTNASSLDDLTRLAIVLGRSRLSFDRLGLWLINDDGETMNSTWGTDANGQLMEEKHLGRRIADDPMAAETLRTRSLISVDEHAPLYYDWDVVGNGWNMMAVLWNGDKGMGWLAADNLLQQQPLLPHQPELLQLYSVTLGHLIARKQIEEELRRSEEVFAKAFRSSPSAMSISTVEDSHYVDVNESWQKLFGFSREEAVGKGKLDPNFWDDPETPRRILQMIRERGGARDIEVTGRSKSGKQITALVSTELIEINGVLHYLNMSQDVTERKHAEQQRLDLALANERVELLTEFLGNISHDLKTPLAVINTSLYLVEQLKDPEGQKHQLRKIQAQTQLLEKLIQNILTISRLDYAHSIAQDTIYLNALVQKVEGELRPSAEKKKLKTMLNLGNNVPLVLGDEDELHRVLVNLVENALNYTPEGGTVVIDTFAEGDHVIAKISDTGIGIDSDELPHIFDRFYRSNRAKASIKSGSGLGLAIVKRVVDLHHGTIEIKSSPGLGTTIQVCLPLGQIESRSAGPGNRAEEHRNP